MRDDTIQKRNRTVTTRSDNIQGTGRMRKRIFSTTDGSYLCEAGRMILNEHTSPSVTVIMAPALSNSPQ